MTSGRGRVSPPWGREGAYCERLSESDGGRVESSYRPARQRSSPTGCVCSSSQGPIELMNVCRYAQQCQRTLSALVEWECHQQQQVMCPIALLLINVTTTTITSDGSRAPLRATVPPNGSTCTKWSFRSPQPAPSILAPLERRAPWVCARSPTNRRRVTALGDGLSFDAADEQMLSALEREEQ